MARGPGDDQPHPVDRHVGRRVADKRISLGFNQSDLGRALGVSFQQVQKYEKGSNRISSSRLWDISRFLDVQIGYFFAGLAPRSGAADPLEAFPDDHGATRQSVEISRLAPRLSRRHQKLALDLIKALAERQDSDA